MRLSRYTKQNLPRTFCRTVFIVCWKMAALRCLAKPNHFAYCMFVAISVVWHDESNAQVLERQPSGWEGAAFSNEPQTAVFASQLHHTDVFVQPALLPQRHGRVDSEVLDATGPGCHFPVWPPPRGSTEQRWEHDGSAPGQSSSFAGWASAVQPGECLRATILQVEEEGALSLQHLQSGLLTRSMILKISSITFSFVTI